MKEGKKFTGFRVIIYLNLTCKNLDMFQKNFNTKKIYPINFLHLSLRNFQIKT